MHRWAQGQSLATVLTAAAENGQELSAGDFVRWCRQVIDLLDQLAAVAAPGSQVGHAAKQAVRAVRRGVVGLATI
jgi:ATP-dependent RNA helicase HelY